MVTLGKSFPRGLVLGALASLLLLGQPAQAVVVAAPAAYSATSVAGSERPQAVQAFLSGRVWSDTDQDGIQDEGELLVWQT